MKRILLVLSLILIFAATASLAGGDKNHGDKGKGTVRQVVGP